MTKGKISPLEVEVIAVLRSIDLIVERDTNGKIWLKLVGHLPNGKRPIKARFEIDDNTELLRTLTIISNTDQTLDKR